ncbi:MAG TPA: hypothetical protein VKU94_02460 [Geobacterales bacterium]|nr:hypothetical protein [Geobacterales bacterium]
MNDKEFKELQSIKKLLVLQLLNAGISAGDIAKTLEMDKGNFSRMFPARKLKAGKSNTGKKDAKS